MPPPDERFRVLFERSPVGMAFVALDGTVLAVNPAACKLCGRSEQELVGSPGLEVGHPDDRGDAAGRLRQLAEGQLEEVRLERRFIRPDGTVVWADSLTEAVRAPDGTPLYLQTILVDITARRQSEAARSWLAAIVQSSQDAIVGTTLDGGIMNWNAGAERIFGYTADEMVGHDASILRPPGSEGEVARLTARMGRGERVEHRVVRARKGGTAVTLLVTSTPILDASGAVVGMASVARGLDQQERAACRKDGSEYPAEISLSAVRTQDGTLVSATVRDGTERRHAAIVASSSDAIIGRSLDGTITSWNGGAERMYGYTAAEAIGSDLAMMVPPERSGELPGMAKRARRGEPTGQFETQRVRKDGTTIEVSVTISPIRDAAGSVVGTSAVARDITESKRAVEELRAVEARKSAILESALDCLVTMDHQGNIVEFNPAAERVFGYRRDQVLGQPMAELIIPPPLRDAHKAGLKRYLETGEGPVLGQRLELPAVRADGTEFPVELAITRVELPGPPVFTAYLRDLTDRKRIEAERQALGERLRQSERLESLGQLAGGVAHDFNNLLGVILNYAAFVAEETAGNPAINADAEQIRTAAERGARLTRQLLIVGRREAIRPAVLDLNAIITDIHDLLSRSIGEQVELTVSPSSGLPAIRADRGQIDQVLLNLAVNARDAMPAGGTLHIATQVADLDEDYLRLHPDARQGRHVELTVTDTGTGIPPEIADRIFEPFFTTKPQGQGTGLGLATVYGIVTEAGGSLSVHSEPGTGTTFRLLFPAVDQPAAPAATPAAGDDQGHGETILVVEDEAAMMEVTTRILRRHGYTVVEAATGPEAIALAAKPDVRLLLTDSVMPQMSGPELARQIRQLRPELPVLFMSGYDQGMTGTRPALSQGAALVQKPFDARTLLSHVRSVLPRASKDPSPAPRE